MRGYLAAIGLALMLVVAGLSYTQGKAVGKTQCLAERSIAADRVQAAIDLRDQSSATARVDMLDYLAAIPKIEATTNDSAERVRIVYREAAAKAVPGACPRFSPRPERVRTELDAAYRATAASISAMRRPGAGSASDGP